MPPGTDWWNDPAQLDEIRRRPPQRPQPVVFAQNAPAQPDSTLPPMPGYQNPGAGNLPGFTPIGQPTRALAPGYASPAEPPLSGTDMPAALRTPDAGRASTLNNLFQGSQGTQGPRLPQVFNGGVQSTPDIAIPATGGTPPGPGYRRTISADGGPSFWQTVRPEERGLNGQDLLRQGTSAAEIQAAHPGWSATQQLDLHRQLQQDAMNQSRQNFALGNQTANRNAGIMNNADSVSQGGLNLARTRTEHDVSADRVRDQIAAGVIGQGGNADDVKEAMDAYNASRPARTGSATGTPGTSFPVSTTEPPPVGPSPATSTMHRTLDQHLRSAMTGANLAPPAETPGRGQGRVQLSLPATTGQEPANLAITNFVHSVASAGMLTPENLPQVMSYMTQRFGAHRVDPWFQHRFSALNPGSAHQEGVNTIMNLANGRGANAGYTDPARSPWTGGAIGNTARAIHGLFQ